MAPRAEPKTFTVEPGKPAEGARRTHEVVSRILELVRTGNLKPGDRLPPERELIEIFGLSRPSLREGLRALDALGVTESRHGGGSYVSDLDARKLLAPLDFYLSLSPANMDESFDCRRVIEVEALRLAVARADRSDVAVLQSMVAAHATVAGDPVGFRILDSRFHEYLWALSGNSLLVRMCHGLYNLGLDLRRRATEAEGQIATSTADHRLIVDAIAARDPDAAAAAMTLHIDHIAETTRQVTERSLARLRPAG